MSFGETLRAAREAKGLTCSEVAMQTRLLVQIVEEMEQEDFHRIAAPIYGRGFVRLYASCVGLDPTPLVAEFMEIYEGHRAPIVKTRAVPTTQESPAPLPPLDTPPVVDYAPPTDPPPPPPMPDFVAHPPEIPTESKESAAESPIAEVPALESPVTETPSVEPMAVEQTEPEQDLEPQSPSIVDEPAPAKVAELDLVEAEPGPAEEPPVDTTTNHILALDVKPSPPPPAAEPTSPVAEPASPVAEPTSPVAEPASTMASEPPPALRGLDLFEQAYANQKESTTVEPSLSLDESPFLPPSYEEEEGPSAGERFRQGLSNVSLGILTTVKRIPRSTWRFSFLGLSSVAVLALIAFACIKLYQFTTPPSTQQPDVPAEQQAKRPTPAPITKPTSAAKIQQKASDAVKTPAVQKTAQHAHPQTPGALRSTGQKIPSLYVD